MVKLVEIFLIAMGLVLGYFIVYINQPPKTILKYPTLANIGNTTYIDENGQCYKYYAIDL